VSEGAPSTGSINVLVDFVVEDLFNVADGHYYDVLGQRLSACDHSSLLANKVSFVSLAACELKIPVDGRVSLDGLARSGVGAKLAEGLKAAFPDDEQEINRLLHLSVYGYELD